MFCSFTVISELVLLNHMYACITMVATSSERKPQFAMTFVPSTNTTDDVMSFTTLKTRVEDLLGKAVPKNLDSN